MKLVCPTCGSTGSIEMFLNDAARRQSVITALEMPAPLNRQIMAYIGLFRPSAKRSLSWDRVDKLLAELLVPIKAAKVERKGRYWPAPVPVWMEAFDKVLASRDRLTLPMKSHGYLYEIVVGLSDKVEAKQERDVEKKRQQRPVKTVPDVVDKQADTEAWKRDMIRLGQRHLVEEYEATHGGNDESH